MTPRALAAAVIGLLALIAGEAAAQATGGSFGGGSFEGGGSSGGSYGGTDEGGGGGGGEIYALVGIIRFLAVTIGPVPTLVLVGLGVVVWMASRSAARTNREANAALRREAGYGALPVAASPVWREVDVTALRIAIHESQRAAIEAQLSTLASRADVRTKEGLVRIVHGATEILLGARASWTHVGVTNFRPMASSEAEPRFRELSAGARAGVESAGVTPQVPAPAPSAGPLLVTILCAARRELVDVHAPDPDHFARALAQLRTIEPGELVAIELVWWPPEGRSAWSAPEMLARHPGLAELQAGWGPPT
jgi:uncharacterized membrane protein